jgi:hypothetical protein
MVASAPDAGRAAFIASGSDPHVWADDGATTEPSDRRQPLLLRGLTTLGQW